MDEKEKYLAEIEARIIKLCRKRCAEYNYS
jgi:hypothetical protein